ncbi:MAG: hypothetical protein NXI04_23130 [Planctomycetaceae bacterium]|nr:hypothetical protein [Planctomycetaceae bacterium]
MSSDGLNVNSVDRFRKSSPRLVLEEHGSCEVPAGCAGVVLRWHNPDAGQPVVFRCAAPGRVELFVNGQAIASRAILNWGDNTLAVRITQIDTPTPFLMTTRRDLPRGEEREANQLFLADGCSSADGSWLACAAQDVPADGTAVDCDVTNWQSLRTEATQFPDERTWMYESLQQDGAAGLMLPAGATVLVRTQISVVRGEA